MLQQSEQFGWESAPAQEPSTTVATATQIYQQFHQLCVQLQHLGEEAVVLCSGSQGIVGTARGTAFVGQEPDLVHRFQQFCQGKTTDIPNGPEAPPEQVVSGATTSKEDDVPLELNDDLGQLEKDLAELEEEAAAIDLELENDPEYIPENESCRRSSRSMHAKKKQPQKRQEANATTPEKTPDKITSNTGIATRRSRRPLSNKSKPVVEIDVDGGKSDGTTDTSKLSQDSKDSEAETTVTEVTKMEDKGTRTDTKLLKPEDMEVVTPEEANVPSDAGQLDAISCFKCSKECHGIGRLREHMTKVHRTKIGYVCQCKKFFTSREVLEKHAASTPHYTCSACPQTFLKQNHLTAHLRGHEPIPVETESETKPAHACQKCGTIFEFEQFLELHKVRLPDCENIVKNEVKNEKEIFNEEVTVTENGVEVKRLLSELVAAQKKPPCKCVLCNVSYNRKSNFTRHMMTHVSNRLNTCTVCGMKFLGLESMTRHRREHVAKPYNCFNCRARFVHANELDDHMQLSCRGFNSENLKCHLCGYTAPSKSALEKHNTSHTGARPFTCSKCGKGMATRSSLERHLRAVHREGNSIPCPHCDKIFNTKDTFRKHEKIHLEPKFHCEICGKGCTESGNLKKHMMTHTGEKPYVCEEYVQGSNLNKTKMIYTGEKPYNCEICGKAYGRKSLMENHRRLHTGEKPYCCTKDGCDKRFRCYTNLKQHIRSHSATHPYVCDICGRRFKQPGRLNHHRKDHLIDYRWPCAYCPNKYKSLFMYKNHLAKCHPEMKKEIEETTNIRLYECSICPKMYGDKEDLTRHIYIHTGQKPFNCQYCNKAFNDKSNMKQHEKIHTGDRKFICTVCNKGFIHNKTLRLHMKTSHDKIAKMPLPGDRRGLRVLEPAVVTTMMTSDGMEAPMIRIEGVHSMEEGEEHEEILIETTDKAGMVSLLKQPDLRADPGPTLGTVSLLQARPAQGITIDGHTLLEPLMIIENF